MIAKWYILVDELVRHMRFSKKKLIKISYKVDAGKKITPADIDYLLEFNRTSKEHRLIKQLRLLTLPLSLFLGFLYSVFPSFFSNLVKKLPSWTNLSPDLLRGVDYLWDLFGDPIKQSNLLYHVPNIILYGFGIAGVKKIFDAINQKTWRDRVLAAQNTLQTKLEKGDINIALSEGHSILFVGKGDFIGMQFTLNAENDSAITVSQVRPSYVNIWNYYDPSTGYRDLREVLQKSGGSDTGEYIFFPIKDDQIFLPGPAAYDLSPYKLDILCQNIRTIEKKLGWGQKRIIIVGDKYHKSFVQSEDRQKVIEKTQDIISLESIAKKYKNTTVLDPTDIVIKKIITIARGRKIVFRATREGIKEYKKRFYVRLEKLKGVAPTKPGILTIGYDLFEDQIEQQTLTRKIDDYFPVVLSKHVHDALLRNGYKSNEFLYVPDLVLQTLTQTVAEQ